MRKSNMPKSHNSPTPGRVELRLAELHREYCALVGVSWPLPRDVKEKSETFLERLSPVDLLPKARRKKILFTQINTKFRLNRSNLQGLYDYLANAESLILGKAEKDALASLFDAQDEAGFRNWLTERELNSNLTEFFVFPSNEESLAHYKRQLSEATINRSDSRSGVQDERREAALRALFGGWLFNIHSRKEAFEALGGPGSSIYSDNYFDYLRAVLPEVLKRSCGHYSIRVLPELWDSNNFEEIRDWLCGEIESAYNTVSNHSVCSVLIETPRQRERKHLIWELACDVTLFAERHREEPFKSGFFKPEKIEEQTKEHITTLDSTKAKFTNLSYGFFYKDCFISTKGQCDPDSSDAETQYLLLTFEKNLADETIIPCPACRSYDVRGNSYPTFGVKSWECQNPLCPERSAFDRGNRYSAQATLRHESLHDRRALIPASVRRKWKLDVVSASISEALEMLIRHFSLPDDSVTLKNWGIAEEVILGRKLSALKSDPDGASQHRFEKFMSYAFFDRYLYPTSSLQTRSGRKIESAHSDWLSVYCGSCIDVLANLPEGSVDGAITSPPYYNAREYSSWKNVYTYLYDMRLSAEGVYRVLAPGGYYLFNIFDYFDNENIFAFSTLGKKRLPLSSYCQTIFRRCGFEIAGNIAWFKGEIEGKRNYNQGNNVPFLQLPLNTWEHVLILRKPGNRPKIDFPEVVFRRPVVKMIRGENRHGHTAPFPVSIPDLLTSRLPRDSVVLDPFAGSFTTAVSAKRNNLKSVCIELSEEYCKLGISKVGEATGDLFSGL